MKSFYLYGIALLVILAMPARLLWAQGPPFQTDDPVPVDLHHYEFYIFGATNGTPIERDVTGPALEFNWGAISRVQLHAVLPLGAIAPADGATVFGPIDAELGVKIALIKESKYVPQIGSFTMFEMPTGSSAKGLGVGKVWYRLPLWAQKNFGKWLVDGGGGATVVPQTGYRNFAYEGFLVKYTFAKRLELGTEAFHHGPEGVESPASTLIDVGGYYHFNHNPNQELLFCYGHSIAGQAEDYAYLALYWTWGKDEQKSAGGFLRQGIPAALRRNGFE